MDRIEVSNHRTSLTNAVETKVSCVRSSTDADENGVTIDLERMEKRSRVRSGLSVTYRFLISTLGTLDSHSNAVAGFLGTGHFGVEFEFETLFCQDFLKRFAHVHVDAHAADVREKLDARHFGTQSTPYGTLRKATCRSVHPESSVPIPVR